MVTLHLALRPSPLIGTFVTTLSAVVVHPAAAPTPETFMMCNAPSVSPLEDSGAVGTGMKSGVKKFCTS